MSTQRILLGKSDSTTYEVGIQVMKSVDNAGHNFDTMTRIKLNSYTVTSTGTTGITRAAFELWNYADTIQIIDSSGTLVVETAIRWADAYGGNRPLFYVNDISAAAGVVAEMPYGSNFAPIGWTVINKTLAAAGDHHLLVSIPGIDATNPTIASGANLIFDSTSYVENSLMAVQSGSTILAGYKHRRDTVFHAGNRTNVSIDITTSKGTGDDALIPMVMIQFAVCNSSGHFHPNYADSANSKELAYMDSVWIKQLNVIGGTINTEHQNIEMVESWINKGRDGFNYGQGDNWKVNTSVASTDPGYNQPFPYGTIHGMDGGAGLEKLTGGPGEDSGSPNYFGKHLWATLNLTQKPNRYIKTPWETLVRPDGWNWDKDTDTIRDFTPQSYAQMEAPFGSIDRRIDKTVNKTQYTTPGRTGYWKQKTWGLIYYVDNRHLIIQAFNDKSTSNAMVSTTAANAHYNSWLNPPDYDSRHYLFDPYPRNADLGRFIASEFRGDFPYGSLDYGHKSRTNLYGHPFGYVGGTGGHGGLGAFSHDLPRDANTTVLHWPVGYGADIFDYYHDPSSHGIWKSGTTMMQWFLNHNKENSLNRRVTIKTRPRTATYTKSPTVHAPKITPEGQHLRGGYGDQFQWGSFQHLTDGDPHNFGGTDGNYPDNVNINWGIPYWHNNQWKNAFDKFVSGTDIQREDTSYVNAIPPPVFNNIRDDDHASSTDETFYFGLNDRGWFGPPSGEDWPIPHGYLFYSHYRDWVNQHLDPNLGGPLEHPLHPGHGDAIVWEVHNNDLKYKDTPARQEHMPRPYMGGWDNFLWDNVPLQHWLDCQIYPTDPKSAIAPWMTFSNCLKHMHLVPNGYPLWYDAARVDPTGYSTYWWWFRENDRLKGLDTPTGGASTAINADAAWFKDADTKDTFTYRPWNEIDTRQHGHLSFREAITPNTEVTTINTNHFNPMTSNATHGEVDEQWDYFYVSYAIFNQSVGVAHQKGLPQQNKYIYETLDGTVTKSSDGTVIGDGVSNFAKPDWPEEPFTGQPLHD